MVEIWGRMIGLTIKVYVLGEIQAIDTTGMDRIPTCQHYANRSNYTFKIVKATFLVDRSTGAILEFH